MSIFMQKLVSLFNVFKFCITIKLYEQKIVEVGIPLGTIKQNVANKSYICVYIFVQYFFIHLYSTSVHHLTQCNPL